MSEAVAEQTEHRQITLDQRIYVNGFPKAGTHMAEAMVAQLATKINTTGWAGTFGDNAWSTRWLDRNVEKFIELAPHWYAGGYLKGHCGYKPELAAAFKEAGVSMVFIYRDLRDVAVSAAFHSIDPRMDAEGVHKLKHPDKDLYMEINERHGFEGVLLAQILGVQRQSDDPDVEHPRFAGVVDRWQLYAGWMGEPWVCKVPYEYMRHNTAATARAILEYVTKFTLGYMGYNTDIAIGEAETTVKRMVAATKNGSTTFRRGKPGNWQEYWTPRLEAAFERVGGNEWLRRLGYKV